MEVRELRIGNYVNPCHDGSGIIVPIPDIKSRVFQIEFEKLHLANDHTLSFAQQECFWYAYKMVEPIPLTEEWLLNFGFEFIKTESAFNTFTDKNNNYFLQIDNRKNNGIYKILYDDGCELIDFAIKGIKHVHQLQNLYFALTGEELTLRDAKN